MKLLMGIVLLLVLFSVSITTWGLWEQKNSQHDICVAVNKLDIGITTSLRRSFTTLPTLSYYKHHPAELAKALAQTAQTIASFEPQNCN